MKGEKIYRKIINALFGSKTDNLKCSIPLIDNANKSTLELASSKKDNDVKTIEIYDIGIVKQFGEKDFITERKKNYGFIQTMFFKDLYFHKKDTQDKHLTKNDIVMFQYGKNEKGKVAKNVILLKDDQISFNSTVDLINKFGTTNTDFFKTTQFSSLLQTFLSKKYLSNMEEYVFLMLLKYYSKKDIISIIDDYVSIHNNISISIADILLVNINNNNLDIFLNTQNKERFLNNPEIDKKVKSLPSYVKLKYTNFLEAITQCQNYKHVNVSFEPNEIYSQLKPIDYVLAKQWMQPSNNYLFEYAKMISARGAELAAIKFYTIFDYKVIDTAITQINKTSNDWKLFDLHVNDIKYIDVKNSRGVLNEQLSYSEHCIPKFKETRNGNQINILGVISPYFRLENEEEILTDNSFHSTNNIENMITILGEVSLNDINTYASRFSQKNLEVNINTKTFTPDWMLEYPIEFYEERDKLKENFKINFTQYPKLNEYYILNKNLIPFFLSCGIDLPEEWNANEIDKLLNNEQLRFYNRLKVQGKEKITKPFLYLAILTHFTEQLQKNIPLQYTPTDYFLLIYNNEKFQYPLGIYDPTLIIKKLIQTLEALWKEKDRIDMTGYVSFKYNEKGILQAKKAMSKSWDTLIAYCGGFIEKKGSCGFKPLIKGEHETCEYCRKIICPMCNFCSQSCVRLS
ncbi:MAG: cold shock domain-containing protein [Sulfuricurvum sp.]|nr:cold shock domain-containing protein [Sulfuricurvum sp.]